MPATVMARADLSADSEREPAPSETQADSLRAHQNTQARGPTSNRGPTHSRLARPLTPRRSYLCRAQDDEQARVAVPQESANPGVERHQPSFMTLRDGQEMGVGDVPMRGEQFRVGA